MRKSRSDVRLQTRKYLFLIPGSAREEKDRNPERKAKARPRVNESRGTRETNPGVQMDEQTPKESTHESVVEVNSVYFVCYRRGGCCRQSPIESQGRVAGGPWGRHDAGLSFWKPPLRFALGPLYSLSDTNGFSTWLSVTDMPQNKKAEAEETACRLNGVHSPLLAFFFYRKRGRVWGDLKTAYFVCLKMRWALRGAAEVRESQLP